MKNYILSLMLVLTFVSCSNSTDMETGEIKVLQMLKQSFEEQRDLKVFVNSRDLLNREKIDAIKTAVLFVELGSGQNGTLIPYPGQGVGQTWLGADGATITLQKGVVKASRGMGDDLMGSTSSIPPWSKIGQKAQIYSREYNYITGNNKILKRVFTCDIKKTGKEKSIEIWDINFKAAQFKESCSNSSLEIENTYYVDSKGVVRRSSQYLSDAVGYIFTERLDR